MNLEMSIVPKDIRGIEVDLERIIHPIIKSDNNISRVSVLNESYEDAKWGNCNGL
jgi:hypothetical protein